MKPFRFGVNVLSAGSRGEWAAKARKLEAMGYWIVCVPDHLTEMLAPMPALVAAAAATTRLRVSTNVLNNDLRHPVLVAREAATVDLLTEAGFNSVWAPGTCGASTSRPAYRTTRGAPGWTA